MLKKVNILVKIDEENSVPVKTTVGGAIGRTPHINLPQQLKDLKVKLERGDSVLYVDRKNKIIWMPYEEATS